MLAISTILLLLFFAQFMVTMISLPYRWHSSTSSSAMRMSRPSMPKLASAMNSVAPGRINRMIRSSSADTRSRGNCRTFEFTAPPQ